MKSIWSAVWEKVNTKFKFPAWEYLILPILAIALEIVGVLPRVITNLIIHPSETLMAFEMLLDLLIETIDKISLDTRIDSFY